MYICVHIYIEIEGMMNLEIWAPTILGITCETKRIKMKPIFLASANRRKCLLKRGRLTGTDFRGK